MTATKHYLPERDDLPNLAELFCNELCDFDVTLEPPRKMTLSPSDFDQEGDFIGQAPHVVVATSWFHLDVVGPLTEEDLLNNICIGLSKLAQKFQGGSFAPWPMTRKPQVTLGRAYHDYEFAMPVAPVHVRFIMDYKAIELPEEYQNSESDVTTAYGLQFHLVTLVEAKECSKQT